MDPFFGGGTGKLFKNECVMSSIVILNSKGLLRAEQCTVNQPVHCLRATVAKQRSARAAESGDNMRWLRDAL